MANMIEERNHTLPSDQWGGQNKYVVVAYAFSIFGVISLITHVIIIIKYMKDKTFRSPYNFIYITKSCFQIISAVQLKVYIFLGKSSLVSRSQMNCWFCIAMMIQQFCVDSEFLFALNRFLAISNIHLFNKIFSIKGCIIHCTVIAIKSISAPCLALYFNFSQQWYVLECYSTVILTIISFFLNLFTFMGYWKMKKRRNVRSECKRIVYGPYLFSVFQLTLTFLSSFIVLIPLPCTDYYECTMITASLGSIQDGIEGIVFIFLNKRKFPIFQCAEPKPVTVSLRRKY